jgi:hypothetical protein
MSLLVLSLLGTPDGPAMRGKEHEGCGWYSAYDFMTKMCKYQDKGNTARNEFSRLMPLIQELRLRSEYQKEVDAMCSYLKFLGSGQKRHPA